MPKHPQETVPRCPRCGYDQSGACRSWHAECPLEGTCPECGLRFEWADAFAPHRKRLPWLFEHRKRGTIGMIRAWQSWWMTLAPPRFWGRVTPAHNATGYVVWWPLVLAVSLAFFGGAVRLGYLYFTGWKGAWTAWSGGPPQGWTLARTMLVESFIAPYYADSRYWRYNSSSEETTAMWAAPAATVCAAVVSGLTLMCLTSSRRICGVRTVHIVRASVYRTAPLVGFMAVLSARRSAEGTWLERLLAGHAGEAALMLTVAVSLLWALWWWRTVVLKGWVMPGSRVAATLIGVVDVLAGVAVFSELSPYSVGRLFY